MANYNYRCSDCDIETIEFFRFEDRPATIICGVCGGKSEYRIATPMVFKAAYLDGTKRFSDLKEAAKLNKESAHSKPERQKEIAKEIKKLGVGVEK